MNTSFHHLNPVAHIKIVTAAFALAGIAIAVGMLARPPQVAKAAAHVVMQATTPTPLELELNQHGRTPA